MNGLESELFNLEESLMRNDGMADDSTYSTIVGIANEVSELESENAALRTQLADVTESMGRVEERCAKLRELCSALYEFSYDEYPDSAELNFADRLRELGVEV